VSAETSHPVIQIIDDNEHNIGTFVLSRSAVSQRDKHKQTREDVFEPAHSESLYFILVEDCFS
jgi:hypothetical protein